MEYIWEIIQTTLIVGHMIAFHLYYSNWAKQFTAWARNVEKDGARTMEAAEAEASEAMNIKSALGQVSLVRAKFEEVVANMEKVLTGFKRRLDLMENKGA